MKTKNITNLISKVKEACLSVMPIVLMVLLLSFTVCPLPNDKFIAFVIGAGLLVVGLGLFSLGAEMSMTRIGSHVGSNLTKSKKLPIISLIAFIVGVLITVSEPDLHVLAGYTPIKLKFIIAVAAGLGVFLVVAVLRIIFNIKLKYILLVGYGIVIALSCLVPSDVLAIAYDAGGVTTGVMSVPFVMSIGAGIASMSDQKSGEDSTFGLMAICSIGPIIAVLIMGLTGTGGLAYEPHEMPFFMDSQQMGLTFLKALPKYMGDVAMGLLPIIAFFLVFQYFYCKMYKQDIYKILIGAIYTFLGIMIFLVGVNVGFMPVGSYIGTALAGGGLAWTVVPIGMILGFAIIYAEPAVGVLEKQVEEATSGSIPKKMLPLMMALGVALSSGIALLRALTGMSLLPFLIVGYVIAVLLALIVPGIFTSIAFDAGGVASGVMTATFLLPLTIGVCVASGGDIMSDAFGTIALVAMTPPISIQIMGLVYKYKIAHAHTDDVMLVDDNAILNLDVFDEQKQPSPSFDLEIVEFDVQKFLN